MEEDAQPPSFTMAPHGVMGQCITTITALTTETGMTTPITGLLADTDPGSIIMEGRIIRPRRHHSITGDVAGRVVVREFT